jgi:hypothetical protein
MHLRRGSELKLAIRSLGRTVRHKVPPFTSFERFDRGEEIGPPSGRLFGFALAIPFAVGGCVRSLRGGEMRWWAASISGALALAAVVHPAMFDRMAAASSEVLRPMHRTVTIAAMALLFFLVVTPVGCLRRLLVRDPLRLRFEPNAASYWQERQAMPPETMANQF